MLWFLSRSVDERALLAFQIPGGHGVHLPVPLENVPTGHGRNLPSDVSLNPEANTAV